MTILEDKDGNGVNINFSIYQKFVESMKVYPEKHAIVYPILGLTGESGEIANKVKKWLRGDSELDKKDLIKELGDCLWYIASAASDLGSDIEEVAELNILKLTKRKEDGTIKGSGDDR